MQYTFFYVSLAAIWLGLLMTSRIKPLNINHLVIGIATTATSLTYDIILGEYMKLYYYIAPSLSPVYMTIGGILIYPPLNILYTQFLPQRREAVLAYSSLWGIAMLVFEYFSVAAHTIVFTGWRPLPWSILTYTLTYAWVYLLYRALIKQNPHRGTA